MNPILQRLRPLIFPRNSLREKLARLFLFNLSSLRSNIFNNYHGWIRRNEPSGEALSSQIISSKELKYKPLISLVLPIDNLDNPDPKILREAINIILSQTYYNWELWITASEIPPAELRNILEKFSSADRRIQTEFLELNDRDRTLSINKTIEKTGGEYIVFLNASDCLAPFSLYELASTLNDYPQSDLVYSDEDRITYDGTIRCEPIFKPAFSPDYLRSVDYIGSFIMIRKSLGEKLGWLRKEFHPKETYDLLLRVAEQASLVTHIPKILNHRRDLPYRPITAPEKNSNLLNPEIKALQEHLLRCNLSAEIENGAYEGIHCLKYKSQTTPLISIIIPNKDHALDLSRCVDSILSKSAYQNFEILIVENNSTEHDVFNLYNRLETLDKRARIETYNMQQFNFSEINNFAAKKANGEFLLFLNNDTQILNTDWLDRLLEYAVRPDVGAVGAKLYFPNMLIQHAGIVVGLGVGAGHYYVGSSKDNPGYQYNLIVPHNLSSVTAACLMMRHTLFDDVNGFDPGFRLGYGDIDLCLKICEKNYSIIWTPYAELIHYESMTRGFEDSPGKQARFFDEANLLMDKWAKFLDSGDPFYNPNLSLNSGNFTPHPGICKQSARAIKNPLMQHQ